jgi:hypothetical protein
MKSIFDQSQLMQVKEIFNFRSFNCFWIRIQENQILADPDPTHWYLFHLVPVLLAG